MNSKDKALCAAYAVIALAALILTWNQNLAFFAMPDNGGMAGFLRMGFVNPAAASFTIDLLLFGVAANLWMVVEARRLGVRFVWIYVVLSFLIAVSVMFPLFLIARQRRLSTLEKSAKPSP